MVNKSISRLGTKGGGSTHSKEGVASLVHELRLERQVLEILAIVEQFLLKHEEDLSQLDGALATGLQQRQNHPVINAYMRVMWTATRNINYVVHTCNVMAMEFCQLVHRLRSDNYNWRSLEGPISDIKNVAMPW